MHTPSRPVVLYAAVLALAVLVTALTATGGLSVLAIRPGQISPPGQTASSVPEVRSYDDAIIRYEDRVVTDPVAALQHRIDRHEVQLAYNGRHGLLDDLLRQLHIDPASQMLVFSKTSFQVSHISPGTPRALYFNDTTYVGYVQNGDVLEIATTDPRLGPVFYMLPQRDSGPHRPVRVFSECLKCHLSKVTGGMPAFLMRSVIPLPDGSIAPNSPEHLITDQTPFGERWGGWYVTGTHGSMRHEGNLTTADVDPRATDYRDARANVTDLRSRLDVSRYLRPTSDIVALMVAEHQTYLENLIVRAGYTARMALSREPRANAELDSRASTAAEELVRGLLFCGEARLTAQVSGTSSFAKQFESLGPCDRLGRSLRELDLHTRLLRYPCSYLIYSAQFDALPKPVCDRVYRRMAGIFTGHDTGAAFSHLSRQDCRAILGILQDTKPAFASWLRLHRAK